MMWTARQGGFVLAAILACAFLVLAGGVNAFRQQQSSAIFTQQHSQIQSADFSIDFMNRIRGGASDDTDDEESDEEEEGPSLAKSAKAAATKAVKSKIKAAITPKPKKKSSSFFKLPYILKACLNPFVFWKMTAGYWKSLYNIDYMAENTEDSSQGLRSALEQKARLGGGAKPKGKRKMKPGQAKTLSDLPALNT